MPEVQILWTDPFFRRYKPDAENPEIALWLTMERQGRRVTDLAQVRCPMRVIILCLLPVTVWLTGCSSLSNRETGQPMSEYERKLNADEEAIKPAASIDTACSFRNVA